MNDVNYTNTNITKENSDDGGATSWDNNNRNADSVKNKVNNDNITNIAITDRPVTIKPRRLITKLGHNYEVSVHLNCLIHLAPIISAQPKNHNKSGLC